MTADAGARAHEIRGQAIYWQLMLTGVFSVAKLLITSAGDVKRFRRPSSSEQRYVRPERLYELPPYRDGMRVTRSRARCAMAVPEASDSRQPRFPQPQSGPSGATVVWPISPAIPSAP